MDCGRCAATWRFFGAMRFPACRLAGVGLAMCFDTAFPGAAATGRVVGAWRVAKWLVAATGFACPRRAGSVLASAGTATNASIPPTAHLTHLFDPVDFI